MLNEERYSDLGAWGSVRDWFISNSNGGFSPQFDVVGPIRLSQPRAYYGANKGSDDIRPEMMVIEACGLVDDEVDFSQYDEDGDGLIDNIFVFYAGYGENLGAGVPSECVWPHSWDIMEATSVPYYFDGKRLNHYACTNEIDLTNTMDGIGTFIHEFSHVMGLPDLYATNYSYAFTPGKWSVMDEGPYNNNSRTPPYYSAFERLSLGWLDPVKIDRPANIKLPEIAENRAFWIPTENENEYYLLENRQQTGWDTFLPYHGMLVWHIDYNENIWRYNTVNDRKDHQYVDIIEADDIRNSDTLEGDPFPGLANITSFTDDTTPAMRSWAGIGCGVPLTDIYESNGYVYLKAMGGKSAIDPVVALEAENVGIDNFTARWEATADGIGQYVLSVYTTTELPNGQVSIDTVEGYEALNVGSETTSYLVEGLEPGAEYRYTLRVLDPETNQQSAPSNEITVALLPPTFDYLTPLAVEAEEITSDGFTARWNKLEEADTYKVTVVTKSIGEPEATYCGFTGGLSALPEGWTTNSKLTYSATDYCGEDVPSLRFNSEGKYLEMVAPEGYVRGLSFWSRLVGSIDEATLEVQARISGEWHAVTSLPLDGDYEHPMTQLSEEMLPFGADALRIEFHPTGKGSVAIDDVTLLWGGETTVTTLPEFTNLNAGDSDRLAIKGLLPSTEYYYTVTAVKEGVNSRKSNEIRVVTKEGASVNSPTNTSLVWSYDRITSLLTVRGLEPEEPLMLVAPDGSIRLELKADSEGTLATILPRYNGVSILRFRSGLAVKILN